MLLWIKEFWASFLEFWPYAIIPFEGLDRVWAYQAPSRLPPK